MVKKNIYKIDTSKISRPPGKTSQPEYDLSWGMLASVDQVS